MIKNKVCMFFCALMSLGTYSAFNVNALSNGLAKTPPMGWNSWNIFHENINEKQIKEIADAMVSTGMKDAGYIYLNLDDNWMATSRDANGALRADPTRFPSGMKALGDYIHSKGLKFGVYGDRGLRTCHHYYSGPIGSGSGSYGKEEMDAKTFASWGVDYLKYDNCDPSPGSNMQRDYEKMRDALANCGRPIVFSVCAWGYQPWMPATGNLWRTTGDITDKWDNGDDWFKGIINAVDGNAGYVNSASPGGWNDPDMLEIGNGGCTIEEYRTQMSMWCIMASPLIAGNEIRTMNQATKEILLNREAIAVNQDSAGIQGTRVKSANGFEVWCKPLGTKNGNTKAVALLNRNGSGANVTVNFSDIGLSGPVYVRDLWTKSDKGSFNGSYTMSVPSHGTGFLKLTSIPPAPRSAFAKIEAESFNSQSGIQTESNSEGGECIGFIQNGDFVFYSNIDFGAGADGFQVRTSSNSSGGTIELGLDSITGFIASTCLIRGTGNWNTWVTSDFKIPQISGKHDLYLKFTGSDEYLLNVDWFIFNNGVVSSYQRKPPSGLYPYRTEVSKGDFVFIPIEQHREYSIALYMPDGRLITTKDHIIGKERIPVQMKGVCIMTVRCGDEKVESTRISLF